MQTISDSVGFKGANKKSDVALVQAILLKTACLPDGNNSSSGSKTYLASYSGEYGKGTEDALRAFQGDYVNVTPDGRQCMQNPDAMDALVRPSDATWKKLMEKVDRAFTDMRILDGGKPVYLEGPAQQLAASLATAGSRTFGPNFRPKVIACINQMQAKFGIVLSVCPQGDRRTFQQQQDVWVRNHKATHAGPGESNHNFGMAVDLGFQHLRWLKNDGTLVEERSWYLESLKDSQGGAEEARFWQVFRALGTGEVGAFRGPVDDLDHLQNWDDHGGYGQSIGGLA